uniref:TolC family protein n=1 Tax=Prevotella sp. GTC17260 TaxID=3236796 RepID=A0AB33JBR8_9BACT
MKREILLFIGLCMLSRVFAQLTLESCKQLAHDNYPAIRQYALIEQSRDYTAANAAKAWLPQVSLSASGYAFTDLIDKSTPLGAVGLNTRNYMGMAQVQVNQTLYDGGSVAAKKGITEAEAAVKTHQLNVAMYDINRRIEQLYFGILTLDEQLRQVALLQKDLDISEQAVKAMMKEGVANQSDADAVSVEQAQARQLESSLHASRRAFATMLATFIGREVTSHTSLARPVTLPYSNKVDVRRPELEYYTAQSRLLMAQRKVLDARLKPHLGAFGMANYHSRMASMVNNGLLAAGLTLIWNIGALYTRKNDLGQLALQQQHIDSERETFLFNNRLQNEQSNGIIDNLQRQIEEDDEIIRLRISIRERSELKVKNGTETVNELLRNVNAVSRARQSKALHELQLLQEIYHLHELNNN